MSERPPILNAQTVEEATAWFIDLGEGEVSLAERAKFDAWLRRSPEHVQAYLSVAAFWERSAALKPGSLDVHKLVAELDTRTNVHELPTRGPDARPLPVPAAVLPGSDAREPDAVRHLSSEASPSQRAKGWLAAATVALAIGAVAWYALSTPQDDYSTGVGEQRSIALDDGSTVELNSASRLHVRYTEEARVIDLLDGQALFTVTSNPSRPFIVRADGTSVRAVGTQFDVYRKSSGTIVTVVEGRVAVENPKVSAGALASTEAFDRALLSAGEQLIVTAQTISAPKRTDVRIATAWTEHKLIFDATPLGEVVEEFNRYNRQQLVLVDPELRDYHISGVFPSTDSSGMIEFLRHRFGVTLSRSGNALEISRRAPPPNGNTT